MFELVVMLRDRIIGRSVFDQEVVKIGRTPDNDIAIDNLVFTRNHAAIRRRGPVYTVEDLGTVNGTFVNGRRIERHHLSHGDRVTIGKFTLLFRAETLLPAVGPGADIETLAGRTLTATRAVSRDEEAAHREERCVQRAHLIVDPDGERRTIKLERDVFTIGRAASSDLRVGGLLAPRRLAFIARGLGGYSLVVTGPPGSVRLEGAPAALQTFLAEGDRIAFGDVVAVFRLGAPLWLEVTACSAS